MKKKTNLWSLGISPLTWAMHFMATYLTAAVWCAKFGRTGPIGPVSTAITVYTIVSLMIVIYQMVKGYKQHNAGESELPHDDDSPEDRERFLGLANSLISGLCVVAIIFVAYNGMVFRSCH